MAWDVQFDRGIWFLQAGWWLDTVLSVDRPFVSHGHLAHLTKPKEILPESGTVLNFSRISRGRTEKTVTVIDTVETCRPLFGNNVFADVSPRH